MAAKIEIKKLGPVDKCIMSIEHFTILTGAQASGKSTIAKCIYFCRTIKDDILDNIIKYKLSSEDHSLKNSIMKALRGKFLQMFGTSMAMNKDMMLKYYYSDDTYVSITLGLPEGSEYINPKFVMINFSNNIYTYIKSIDKTPVKREDIKSELNELFNDEYDAIFIPAGRSLISLFTTQLNYMFATMDDEQKRSIDYCTQKYIEHILRIRPSFSNGLDGLSEERKLNYKYNISSAQKLKKLISSVLKGKYIYTNGEERLYLTDDIATNKYVKINFTSSGQQETVWIFNILFNIIVSCTKAFIILEEPEAHLYPDAQNTISEILGLMSNNSCEMLITTHSPYILGALNNLIYSNYVTKINIPHDIIDQSLKIDNHNAYFVENGTIRSCIENTSEKLIENEVIDGASEIINELYDKLFELVIKEGEK